MGGELVVGVDLGTTALKGGLFDLEGNLLGVAEAGYPILRPHPDRAEHDPAAWLTALEDVLAALAESADGKRAAALGICSQVNTHVFVDQRGEPLRPAILWQDQRCAEIADELNDRLAATAPATAGRFVLAPSFAVPRAEWLRREEPDIWERTRSVLSPKDFVTMHLCRLDTPRSDSVGSFDLVDDAGAYDPDLLALVEGLGERLPILERFDAPIGTVECRDLPLVTGATVVAGTMDAWGNLYGSGVVEHGQSMEVAGTSEILGVLSRERHPTPGVVSFFAVDGHHLHAGPTQAGGAALAWFARVVGRPIEDVLAAAATIGAGSDESIFLPHLLGERAPLWDSEVRGGFVGLGSDHSLAHLSRAVLEGVAYSARHLFGELEKAAGVEPAELRASGGGSQSDLWCQIKADVLSRPIARVRVRHSGCLGAALLAAAGAGLVDGLAEAATRAVRVERVFEPGADRDHYDELYAVYRELYAALRPAHAALAGLRRETPIVLSS
ncbi:Sugar (pentulose and hexulose) kinase [Gaiella occulta]|uniref:Sugar (Pentulose and hexulose) kinase n=1 Tax=Gaiella occulta TaxID=1002870 RepID=A0A7M2Z1A3_9ACTN|nr:FGGY-family carbohydrate kinase [Gaiella occulta]RDI76070.1 Sugar (pentulose and hexulose) kinase [Gaiella occulta]